MGEHGKHRPLVGRSALFAAALLWPQISDAACRHALALGLDVSGSVDATEYRLQLDGLADALNSDAVRSALFAQSAAPVRLAVYEWSGPTDQAVILPWVELASSVELANVVTTLRAHERSISDPTTAIGAALLAGSLLLKEQTECWRLTLDISGDGAANTGPRPQDVHEGQLPKGLIVNGLVIGSADITNGDDRFADIKELSAYYESYVIRGAGAFVEAALGFEDYAAAMERKLLRELSSIVVGMNDATQFP